MESIKELNEIIEQTLELRISDWELLMELYNRANMMYFTTMHVIDTYSENQQQVIEPLEDLSILKNNMNRLAGELMRYEPLRDFLLKNTLDDEDTHRTR